jgi:ATP-dependent DNA ligase
MAERKPAKKGTQRSATRTSGKASKGFTDEERAAVKERVQELIYGDTSMHIGVAGSR